MTDNKKGPVAANDQAPTLYAKYKANFIRLTTFLIASPETAIMAAVVGFTIGLMLAGLWGH